MAICIERDAIYHHLRPSLLGIAAKNISYGIIRRRHMWAAAFWFKLIPWTDRSIGTLSRPSPDSDNKSVSCKNTYPVLLTVRAKDVHFSTFKSLLSLPAIRITSLNYIIRLSTSISQQYCYNPYHRLRLKDSSRAASSTPNTVKVPWSNFDAKCNLGSCAAYL